jgi:purine-nucleoside phosphorylase
LVAAAVSAIAAAGLRAHVGASWTTDAPFRETEAALAAARKLGVLAVEMEAAALYTFAHQRKVPVLCLAHVTNTMGLSEQDFEKGEADGTADALKLLEVIANALEP